MNQNNGDIKFFVTNPVKNFFASIFRIRGMNFVGNSKQNLEWKESDGIEFLENDAKRKNLGGMKKIGTPPQTFSVAPIRGVLACGFRIKTVKKHARVVLNLIPQHLQI